LCEVVCGDDLSLLAPVGKVEEEETGDCVLLSAFGGDAVDTDVPTAVFGANWWRVSLLPAAVVGGIFTPFSGELESLGKCCEEVCV
jgi:hypothetical protein